MMANKNRVAAQELVSRVHVENAVIDGLHGPIPIRTYTPLSGEIRENLLWLHGGGFSHGGLDQLESHAVSAAIASVGVRVRAVEYRLVPPWNPLRDVKTSPLPGVRYPIPQDDVMAAYFSFQDEHGRSVLGGASAGACHAAAAALRMRDEGATGPTRLLLVYGTFHAALPPASEELRERIRGIRGALQFSPKTVARMNYNYAGARDALHNPHVFPGAHDLTGLPPTFAMDADRDSLRASGLAFSEELRAAGALARYSVIPETSHGFMDRPASAGFREGAGQMQAWLLGS